MGNYINRSKQRNRTLEHFFSKITHHLTRYDTMSKRMKKYRNELRLIASATPKSRKSLLKTISNDLIKGIAEAAWTILEGKLSRQFTGKQLNRMRKNKRILKHLASKKRTSGQKRKLLTTQKGGNFIGWLLKAIQNIF